MLDEVRCCRRTRAEVQVIKDAILEIANGGDGMTLRHLFYRLVGLEVIEKTEKQYAVIGKYAVLLRRSGDIPFGKIVDGSRYHDSPQTFDTIADALLDTANCYRRNYWRNSPYTIEVWSEKDAITALLRPVTYALGVSLMVTRGFSSEGVVQQLAEEAKEEPHKTRIILSMNDYDPSGALMMDNIIARTKHYAPTVNIVGVQVAVTKEHITRFRLTTRPTKSVEDGNSHAKGWTKEDESVELDTMLPADMQNLLREEIERYVDQREVDIIKAGEESERETLHRLARGGRRGDLG